MYSNNTMHYEIPLPQANDTFNPMDWNESSEKLDTAVFNATQVANTARDDLVTAKKDIVDLQNGLDETNDNATKLTARVGVLEQNDNTYAEGIKDLGDMFTAREVAQAQSDIEIAVGKWFRYNGVLYVCTVEIKVGDTIVPNVNCRATNVESEMPSGSGGLVDRIEVLEADDVLLKNRLNTAEADVSALKTTMGTTSIAGIGEGTVTSAIASMNNDVEGNVSDIAEILVRLQALEEGGSMFDYSNPVVIDSGGSITTSKAGLLIANITGGDNAVPQLKIGETTVVGKLVGTYLLSSASSYQSYYTISLSAEVGANVVISNTGYTRGSLTFIPRL